MMHLHLIRRKDAKAAGLKKYFSTSICQRSHISERYTKSGDCIACASEKQRERCALAMEIKYGSIEDRAAKSAERKESSRIKEAERSRQYYALNKEACKKRNAEYVKANPDGAKIRETRRMQKDRDKVYSRNKAWRKQNPLAEKAWQHKRRALKAGAEGSFTKEEIEKLFSQQKGRCAICTKKLHKEGKNKFHADHIEAIINGGSNWISNIQLTCPGCNLRKSDKDPIEFAQKNGKLL